MSNTAYWIAGQTEVVPVAWGVPGTGKTRTVEDFAKAMKMKCITISLSQHEPTDIGGYPRPYEAEFNEEGEEVTPPHVKFLLPEFLMECQLEPRVLLLDELTTCSPPTQAAALRLLTHAKEILHPKTLIFAAANPAGCAANGYDLEPPIVNRMYHHEWEMDDEEWIQKALQGFPTGTEEDYPVLPESWREDYVPRGMALVMSFLNDNKHQIQYNESRLSKHQKEATKHGPSIAWPSRRSWTNAGVLLGAAMSLGYDSETKTNPVAEKLLRGCVGEGCGRFLEWKLSLSFPNWAETKKLLKTNKLTKSKFPKTSDKSMAYLATMFSEAVNAKTAKKENLDFAWQLFDLAMDYGHKDIAVSLKDMLFDPSEKLKGYQIPKSSQDAMANIWDTITTV